MTTFIVPDTTTPQSAKDFLRQKEGISLNLWRKIKQHNEFYINKKKTRPWSLSRLVMKSFTP